MVSRLTASHFIEIHQQQQYLWMSEMSAYTIIFYTKESILALPNIIATSCLFKSYSHHILLLSIVTF